MMRSERVGRVERWDDCAVDPAICLLVEGWGPLLVHLRNIYTLQDTATITRLAVTTLLCARNPPWVAVASFAAHHCWPAQRVPRKHAGGHGSWGRCWWW